MARVRGGAEATRGLGRWELGVWTGECVPIFQLISWKLNPVAVLPLLQLLGVVQMRIWLAIYVHCGWMDEQGITVREAGLRWRRSRAPPPEARDRMRI